MRTRARSSPLGGGGATRGASIRRDARSAARAVAPRLRHRAVDASGRSAARRRSARSVDDASAPPDTTGRLSAEAADEAHLRAEPARRRLGRNWRSRHAGELLSRVAPVFGEGRENDGALQRPEVVAAAQDRSRPPPPIGNTGAAPIRAACRAQVRRERIPPLRGRPSDSTAARGMALQTADTASERSPSSVQLRATLGCRYEQRPVARRGVIGDSPAHRLRAGDLPRALAADTRSARHRRRRTSVLHPNPRPHTKRLGPLLTATPR
jgi:hypothetical protein